MIYEIKSAWTGNSSNLVVFQHDIEIGVTSYQKLLISVYMCRFYIEKIKCLYMKFGQYIQIFGYVFTLY